MKVGFIAGNFDLFHVGHVNILKRAKELVDYLIVAVNTDEFSKRYKRKPIMNQDERLKAVEGCRYASKVILNIGNEDCKKTIKYINKEYCYGNVTHVFHGSDWIGDPLKKQMGFTDEWLEKNGITMVYLDTTKDISTTDIINRIKNA